MMSIIKCKYIFGFRPFIDVPQMFSFHKCSEFGVFSFFLIEAQLY